MNVHHRIVLAASTLAFAVSVQAQSCSGGAEGGMDATGNQCGMWISSATTIAGAPVLAQPVATPGLHRGAIAARAAARTTQRLPRLAQAGGGTPAPAPAITEAPATGRVMPVGVTPR